MQALWLKSLRMLGRILRLRIRKRFHGLKPSLGHQVGCKPVMYCSRHCLRWSPYMPGRHCTGLLHLLACELGSLSRSWEYAAPQTCKDALLRCRVQLKHLLAVQHVAFPLLYRVQQISVFEVPIIGGVDTKYDVHLGHRSHRIRRALGSSKVKSAWLRMQSSTPGIVTGSSALACLQRSRKHSPAGPAGHGPGPSQLHAQNLPCQSSLRWRRRSPGPLPIYGLTASTEQNFESPPS